LPVNWFRLRRQAQHEIVAAKAGTQQAEMLSCQSLDQIAINRAAQKALGDDQAKPGSGYVACVTRAIM